ncbi:MAG: hypothetical protein CFH23_00101 [Alphaproteobacteria bacterium MarineAlpha6_Bin1]|nr:MAG: hypothetical protein CFH23_00101 [Alphaproteobacteria bacterium MarineAlpha6_Bin1]
MIDYFIHFDRSYNEHITDLDKMGLKLPPLIPEVRAQEIIKLSNDNILTAYAEFQEEIGGVVAKVVTTTKGFKSVLAKHIDPGFQITTIEIAENFLEQKEYQKALETATEALSLMYSRYAGLGTDMLKKTGADLQSLRQKLEIHLRPFINELGHQEFFEELQVMNDLDRVLTDFNYSESVADIASLPQWKEQLDLLIIRMLTLLDKKTETLEYDIHEVLPRDFNWGKNYQIHDIVSLAIKSIKEDSSEIGLKSLESPEQGIRLIETLTNLLDSYITMKEFAINYPNVEYIILSRLQQMGSLRPEMLKVKHSELYLKLYAVKHPEVVYDAETKTLIANGDFTMLKGST